MGSLRDIVSRRPRPVLKPIHRCRWLRGVQFGQDMVNAHGPLGAATGRGGATRGWMMSQAR